MTDPEILPAGEDEGAPLLGVFVQVVQGGSPSDPVPAHDPATGPDWVSIEGEWNAGQLSIRKMGEIFNVSHTAIRKHADANGWKPRPKLERVRQKVNEALVSIPPVSVTVSKKVSGNPEAETEPPDEDEEEIDRAVDRVVALVREHQTELGQGRSVAAAMMLELKTLLVSQEQLDVFSEVAAEIKAGMRDRETLLLVEGMDEGERRRAMQRFRQALETYEALVSLATRAKAIGSLAGAIEKFVNLERVSFGLDDRGDPNKKGAGQLAEEPVEARLRRYSQQGSLPQPDEVKALEGRAAPSGGDLVERIMVGARE